MRGPVSFILDGHARDSAMELFFEFDFAVAINVQLGVLPNQSGVRVRNGLFALRGINRLKSAVRYCIFVSVDRQLRADVTRLGRIDTAKTAQPFPAGLFLANREIDTVIVQHGRGQDVVARSTSIEHPCGSFLVHVELPNWLATHRVE